MYFCIVDKGRIYYNYAISDCGSLGKNESSFDHTSKTHNPPHRDADDTPTSTEEVSVPFLFVKVNRRILTNISYKQAKALAFHCLVKGMEKAEGRTASYTINSMHEFTGVHAKTIEQRLLVLEDMDYIGYDEKHKLRLKSIRSKHSEKNIEIRISTQGNVLKNAEKALLAIRLAIKIKQIEFYRNALAKYANATNNPASNMSIKEFKQLRAWLREHCKSDFRMTEWQDYGWSYKSIAKYLGTSIKTAVSVMNFAVESSLINRTRRSICKKISNSVELNFIDYTFCYRGIAYKVFANSYRINPTLPLV